MRDRLLNLSIVAVSCAYAHWLDTHKHIEPDHTWVEVAIGVGYTLAAARELCRKLDAWRQQTEMPLGFSGVLYGDYARLYLDSGGDIPRTLISLVLRHIRTCGTAAICGAWLITLDFGDVLNEQQLLSEVAL